jgi:hypothetical protein
MDKLVVTNIDTDVGNAFFICIFEKDKVAWLGLVDVEGTAVVAFC